MSEESPVREKYERALSSLVEKLKEDRHVLAVILCGSMSHDEVWKKSDIDLAVVTTDDLKETRTLALFEDGINVHLFALPRSKFVSTVQGSLQGTFLHLMLSKACIVFSRDDAFVEVFGQLGTIGGRDREIAMLRAVIPVFSVLDKAEKWLYFKRDPLYCFFWLMRLVDSIAHLEILYHWEVPGREVVQHARKLNPELIEAIYDRLIEGPKDFETMEKTLTLVRNQLLSRPEAFEPLLTYLRDADGPRSASDVNHDFSRQMSIDHADIALEWMAEQGMVLKLSMPNRLLPKSRVSVDENAYTAVSR